MRPSWGTRPLGNVEGGHDLDPGDDRGGKFGRRWCVGEQQLPVHPVADAQAALLRLDVNVGRPQVGRARNQFVDDANDRRTAGQVLEAPDVVFDVAVAIAGEDLDRPVRRLCRVKHVDRPLDDAWLGDAHEDLAAGGKADRIDRVIVERISHREDNTVFVICQRQDAVFAQEARAKPLGQHRFLRHIAGLDEVRAENAGGDLRDILLTDEPQLGQEADQPPVATVAQTLRARQAGGVDLAEFGKPFTEQSVEILYIAHGHIHALTLHRHEVLARFPAQLSPNNCNRAVHPGDPERKGQKSAESDGPEAVIGTTADRQNHRIDERGNRRDQQHRSQAGPGHPRTGGGHQLGIAQSQAIVAAPSPVEPADAKQRSKPDDRTDNMIPEMIRRHPPGDEKPGRDQRQGQGIGQQEVACIDDREREQNPAEHRSDNHELCRQNRQRPDDDGRRGELEDRIERVDPRATLPAPPAPHQPSEDRDQVP